MPSGPLSRFILCSRRRLVRNLTSHSPRVFGWAGGVAVLTPPSPLTGQHQASKSSASSSALGILDEENWRPRTNAVSRVLQSWRSRFLPFTGKALVVNALALSRVWYVASLVHMAAWVEKELSLSVFSFFWSGKRELVARSSVSQPHLFGDFSVVNVKYKAWALLGR